MGQFKPMTKMMTTEPSVELKLKKGGSVKKSRVVKKADGGMMSMPMASAPMPAMAPGVPARGGMMAAKRPMRPSMAARRQAMSVPPAAGMTRPGFVEPGMTRPGFTGSMPPGKGGDLGKLPGIGKPGMTRPGIGKPGMTQPGFAGSMPPPKFAGSMPPSKGGDLGKLPSIGEPGMTRPGFVEPGMTRPGFAGSMPLMKKGGKAKMESPAMHKAEMSAIKGVDKKLAKHAAKPASKAHKGMATGGVAMGQGGYKMGGNVQKFAKGGGVEGNVSTTPPGVTNTSTGEVRKGNAGGYKKGGSAKKAFATGGAVNDSGKPVAYPKKRASTPVSINQLSGTFKKGGKVKKYADGGDISDYERKMAKTMDGGSEKDMSKGAYDRSIALEREENEAAREMILGFPKRIYQGVKGLFSDKERKMIDDTKPKGKAVTKTVESVTVSPKKRGGAVMC